MGSFKIVRIAGIDVFIHWSWLVIFGLLVWSLGSEDGFFSDAGGEDWSQTERWAAAVVSTIAFFLSVLLHELSHSLMAKRLGLPVASITLFIFGGVSALSKEPESARDEFKVAIVGPLTSFVIGAGCLIAYGAFYLADAGDSVPSAVFAYLGTINIAVGIFNMLPGYPLDGGRVLRSALWARSRNILKATRWAATAGTLISFALIGLGLVSFLAGAVIGGVWFVVIGLFLRNTSEQAYQQVLLKHTLEGAKVGDIVNNSLLPAPPDVSLAQLVSDFILGRAQRCVPIVVADNLLGIVTMSDLQKIPNDQWGATSAFRAMTPREKLYTVSPQDDLTTALQMMAAHDVHQLPVIDTARSFLGFVTRADVLRLMQVRTELSGTGV